MTPVPGNGRFAVLPDEPVTWRQFEDRRHHGLVFQVACESNCRPQRATIDGRCEAWQAEKRLHLGGEGETAFCQAIEDRFDPDVIPGQQQLPPGPIPQRKAEHSFQFRQTVWAELLIGGEDGLSIGTGVEDVSFLLEFAAQRLKVVDLTVKGDHVRAVAADHRLMASIRGVQDAQPPMTQNDVFTLVQTAVVGTAISHQRSHPANEIDVAQPDRPSKSAHGPASICLEDEPNRSVADRVPMR